MKKKYKLYVISKDNNDTDKLTINTKEALDIAIKHYEQYNFKCFVNKKDFTKELKRLRRKNNESF